MTLDQPAEYHVRLCELIRGLATTPDLDSFLQAIVTEAAELTKSELVSILEYDTGSGQLRFLSSLLRSERDVLLPLIVPLDGSIAGWVYTKRQPLVIQDAGADNRHFRSVDDATRHKTKSMAVVPLIVHGEVLGVLEALNKRDDAHYTEEDLALLETLGAVAAHGLKSLHLQRAIQAAQAEMAELERLKSDFVAITSHELRTPLGLILGHATFLKELVGGEYESQLNAIIKNSTRLKEIVENLSSVDNVQTGSARVRASTVSLAKITEEVLLSFQDEAASKNITLTSQLGSSSYEIDADPVKINIALSNLVKNALQFTDAQGHVTVTLDEDDGYVTVSVSDTGIGIPSRYLPKIFDRFFQVETHLTRKYNGMGLGLSVTKSMIELHNGRIWVESEEGKGTTFTFVLPSRTHEAPLPS